ncbi:Na(+)/H(+) antiporter subunit C [Virgibacillus halophilus]|uniref:Na(+)/H(+) antiporter subunit C n=1 Tax=Tigheibacillus halophilus TaxID=361280 RepID=A0ABU5C4Z3_9BACI|nr:Na(+)/H(+) antiporter subunit C [Virgibacillus halophilus]
METMIIILAGILISVATYLLLSRNVLRIILGTAILSHAAHLIIMTMGGLERENVPLIGGGQKGPYTDALPQALILTSIVISFAVTALLLVLAYRVYRTVHTDSLYKMRGFDDE